MKLRLNYKTILYLVISTLAFSLPLMSMETSLTLGTAEGKALTLEEPLVPSHALELIHKNKAQFDRQLPANAWMIAFDIFAAIQFLECNPSTPLDMTKENPFLKHKVKNHEAEKLIGALLIFTDKNPSITNEIAHAFILFTKGKISSQSLSSLDTSLKTILDKYRYLRFNKHFDLPNDLLGYVSIKELLQFNKIDYPNNSDSDGENHQKLDLNNYYLANLEGWQDLFQQKNIRPGFICVLDLSKNNLKELPSTLLQGFTNLKKLFLDHNKLESLPTKLLQDCKNILIIDLSHNCLKVIPTDFTSYCKDLRELLLNNNPLITRQQSAGETQILKTPDSLYHHLGVIITCCAVLLITVAFDRQ
jgi:hypothetical protein